jgi:hypothetical protein
MRRVLFTALLAGLLLGGCAGGLQYKSLGPSHPPRGTPEQIQVFDRVEPPTPYDRIGQLSGEHQRRKFTPPRLIEILPEMKKKAWEVGGDALVVRKLEEPPVDPDGTLRVEADVVRFRR